MCAVAQYIIAKNSKVPFDNRLMKKALDAGVKDGVLAKDGSKYKLVSKPKVKRAKVKKPKKVRHRVVIDHS